MGRARELCWEGPPTAPIPDLAVLASAAVPRREVRSIADSVNCLYSVVGLRYGKVMSEIVETR
jgi:hypothetical protein